MASLQRKLTNEDGVAREAFTRLAAAADEFEGYAHPHAERIAAIGGELAKLFGLGQADRAALRLAALAHDLGEMAMKRDYIRRAGALNDEERLDLMRHPVIGEQEAAHYGADRGAQLLVRWHQEWWNGTGYPDALSREQIPLAARILRVADAYAALTDSRPFRPARTEEEARKHLAEWAGLEFDPNVVRAFLTLKNLPALRSYARRDEDTATTDAATQDEPRADASTGDVLAGNVSTGDVSTGDVLAGDASTVDAQGWNIGGHIPEAGANPYAQRVETNTPTGGEQNSDSDQDLLGLTKTD